MFFSVCFPLSLSLSLSRSLSRSHTHVYKHTYTHTVCNHKITIQDMDVLIFSKSQVISFCVCACLRVCLYAYVCVGVCVCVRVYMVYRGLPSEGVGKLLLCLQKGQAYTGGAPCGRRQGDGPCLQICSYCNTVFTRRASQKQKKHSVWSHFCPARPTKMSARWPRLLPL